VFVVPGALLGLGNPARGSEWIVMRASGVTTARLRGWPGLAGDDGIRARDGETIIRVHGQPAGVQFGGVQACKFGRDRRLLPVGRAGRASVGKEYLWTPGHDARTRSGDAATQTESAAEQHIVATGSPDCAGLAVADAVVTGLHDLDACGAGLQSSYLDAAHAEIAFRPRVARARSSASGLAPRYSCAARR